MTGVTSLKITLILFIMVCFEIGLLLIFLPWHRSWDNNSLLVLITSLTNSPAIQEVFLSGPFRGAVTGLGLVNILIAIREIFLFKKTMHSLVSNESVSDQ